MLHVECTRRVARWSSAGQWWVEVYLPCCLMFNSGWCVMVLDVVGQEIYGGLEWSAPLSSRDDAEAQLRLSSFAVAWRPCNTVQWQGLRHASDSRKNPE